MKKWLLFGLIGIGLVIVVLISLFITYSDFNDEWRICEIDEDCIFVSNPPCYCGPNVINLKNLRDYNTHLVINRAISLTQGFVACADCIKIAETEPYCNLKKRCDQRINCEKTCDMLQERVKYYENPEEINFYLNQSGCECDFS